MRIGSLGALLYLFDYVSACTFKIQSLSIIIIRVLLTASKVSRESRQEAYEVFFMCLIKASREQYAAADQDLAEVYAFSFRCRRQ